MRYIDEELRELLDEALRHGVGVAPRPHVVRVERQPARYHSTWQMEDVDILLANGQALHAVVKDLSPDAQLDAARGVKPEFLVDPLREIETYRHILSAPETGTAPFLGAVVNERRQTFVLVLGRIEGTPLWQIGHFAVWEAAAAWLARFHLSARRRAIEHAEAARLLRYDRTYYGQWIKRARRFRGASSTEISALARITERHAAATEHLLNASISSFIHGEFQPSNVLVESLEGGRVIRPVDWETAAIGPALMDLADLTAGRWTPAQRVALTDAYWNASGGADFGSRTAFDRELVACRLHRAVQWLGWSADWRPPSEHAQDWLAVALALADEWGSLPRH